MPSERPLSKLPYKDILSVAETYADGCHSVMFNGQVAHIVLTVDRPDEPKPPRPLTGNKVTAVRLVMDANGFIETYNQMHRLISALEAQGLIQREGTTAKRTMQ